MSEHWGLQGCNTTTCRCVLHRPWCLLEMLTAIDNNIPIVAVCLTGQKSMYNYEIAEGQLGNLRETTDEGCHRLLAENGYADLDDASRKLSSSIPRN